MNPDETQQNTETSTTSGQSALANAEIAAVAFIDFQTRISEIGQMILSGRKASVVSSCFKIYCEANWLTPHDFIVALPFVKQFEAVNQLLALICKHELCPVQSFCFIDGAFREGN